MGIEMRFVLAFLLCILGLPAFARGHGQAAPAVVCNLITGISVGVGATQCVTTPNLPACNGGASGADDAAFTDFNSWAVSWQGSHTGLIGLAINAGKNCSVDNNIPPVLINIKNVVVSAYGATLSGDYHHLGQVGQLQDDQHSTRLFTAHAGDTSITVNPSSASQPAGCSTNVTCTGLFSVNGWAMIAGFDSQTGIGFPSNPAFFQYIQITAINSSTGVITFLPPLAHDYLSTWPNFNKGGGPAVPDDGGPATLYAFDPSWNSITEWRGITLASSAPIDLVGRDTTFRDVTIVPGASNFCYNPTMSSAVQIFNSVMDSGTCAMEFDKMVQNANFDKLTIHQIGIQSGNNNLAFNNSTTVQILGSTANFSMNNSTITTELRPGPTTYGRANTLIASNSVINQVAEQVNGTFGAIKYPGSLSEGFNNIAGATMIGGVISIPVSYILANEGSLGWATPGNNLCWGDAGASYSCVQPFQITDVSQSGSNILITTSLAGTYPTWAGQSGLFVQVWPVTSVKFTNVSGTSGEAAMLSLPDCFGLPLYTCYEANYTSASSASTFYWGMFGTISKLEYNVTTVYNGAIGTATVASEPSIHHNGVNTSLATVGYTPVVNLKVLGDRTLDATGGFPASWTNTCGGGTCSGDTLPTISASLADYFLVRDAITDVSGMPGSPPLAVKVKQITNPGLVIP